MAKAGTKRNSKVGLQTKRADKLMTQMQGKNKATGGIKRGFPSYWNAGDSKKLGSKSVDKKYRK